MALAKDRIPHDSSMGSKVQTCVSNETSVEITSLAVHVINEHNKSVLEEEDGSQSTKGLSNDSAITHSPPLCGNGNVFYNKGTNYQLEEAESLINFKTSAYSNLMQASESVLSFQHSRLWENNLHQGYNHWNQISPRSTSDLRLVQDFNCFQTASGYSSIINNAKEKQHVESSYAWLYSEPTTSLADSIQESGAQEQVMKKRLSMVLLPQLLC